MRIAILFMIAVFALLSSSMPAEAQRRKRKIVRTTTVVRGPHRVHRRVVVRKAGIRYHHLPRWGTVVATAPTAAVIIRTRHTPFYFHEGIYYTQRNNGYVVVRPHAGLRIKMLPPSYRTVIVSQRNYYYYYGTFYTKVNNTDEYETVDAPKGAVVDALPEGYEIKTKGDTEYYVLDDVYYAEVDAPEFEDGIGYEVI